MSRQILIEMSERAYEALSREAATLGTTPAAVASSALEIRFSNGAVDKPSPQQPFLKPRGTGNLRTLFGSVSVPDAVDLDNEQIDADLAREYGSTHEDEN